jgi:hypothetical protein
MRIISLADIYHATGGDDAGGDAACNFNGGMVWDTAAVSTSARWANEYPSTSTATITALWLCVAGCLAKARGGDRISAAATSPDVTSPPPPPPPPPPAATAEEATVANIVELLGQRMLAEQQHLQQQQQQQ